MSRNRAVLAHTPIGGKTGVNQYKGAFQGRFCPVRETAV